MCSAIDKLCVCFENLCWHRGFRASLACAGVDLCAAHLWLHAPSCVPAPSMLVHLPAGITPVACRKGGVRTWCKHQADSHHEKRTAWPYGQAVKIITAYLVFFLTSNLQQRRKHALEGIRFSLPLSKVPSSHPFLEFLHRGKCIGRLTSLCLCRSAGEQQEQQVGMPITHCVLWIWVATCLNELKRKGKRM